MNSELIDLIRTEPFVLALALALEAEGGDLDDLKAKLLAMGGPLGSAAYRNVGTAAGNLVELDGTSKIGTALLPDAVLGAVKYRGTWNAATNVVSPTNAALPPASGSNKGFYYKVAVAGSTAIDGVSDWGVGDWVISNGSTYDKIDNTDAVMRVAGLLGDISATALTAALNAFTSSLKGLVPASGGGTANFLRADGTWAAPAAASTIVGTTYPFICQRPTVNAAGSDLVLVSGGWRNRTGAARTVKINGQTSATAGNLRVMRIDAAGSLSSVGDFGVTSALNDIASNVSVGVNEAIIGTPLANGMVVVADVIVTA